MLSQNTGEFIYLSMFMKDLKEKIISKTTKKHVRTFFKRIFFFKTVSDTCIITIAIKITVKTICDKKPDFHT